MSPKLGIPIRLEVQPEFPLVGHKAKVIVTFQNTSDEPMSDVRPRFVVDKPDVFDQGASVELLTEVPEPSSVELLAPGESASFVYHYRVREEGQIRFDSLVEAQMQDGSLFESPLGQSRATNVGKLSVEDFQLVQTLPDVPLIKGKYGALSVEIKNSSPVPRSLSWKLSVTGDDGTFKRWLGNRGEETVPALSSQNLLLPFEGTRSLPIEDEGIWKFTVFGDDPEVFDYDGRSDEVEIALTETYPPEILFVVLEYPEDLVEANVTNATAAVIQSNHGKLINAMLPMPYTPIPSFTTLSVQPRYSSHRHWHSVVSMVARAAFFDRFDRVVVVFPDVRRYWPERRAIGITSLAPGLKVAPTILGTERVANEFPETSTHEILHTFGIDHSQVGSPLVPLAFEVGPGEAVIHKEIMDLMLPASKDPWITESTYNLMISKLSKADPDPEAVIVGGTVVASGEVEADPWYTVWTDQITPVSDEGTHAIVMMNGDGTTLLRHHFDPVYAIAARLLPGEEGPATFPTEESPFVFSLPRHPNLKTIRIVDGENVLHERRVSEHGPVIERMSTIDNVQLAAGDSVQVEWFATDEDGDALSATLSWSADDGKKWVPISLNIDQPGFS